MSCDKETYLGSLTVHRTDSAKTLCLNLTAWLVGDNLLTGSPSIAVRTATGAPTINNETVLATIWTEADGSTCAVGKGITFDSTFDSTAYGNVYTCDLTAVDDAGHPQGGWFYLEVT